MKELFAKMNLARSIIVLSILGSAYLGWAGWERQQEVSFLRGTFAKLVPDTCREIQEISMLNTKLSKDIKGDRFIDEGSADSYARYCADNESSQIGDVTTDPRIENRPGGIIDKTVTIKPVDIKKSFSHAQIAAFLYRLEADSNQVKVTSLSYDLLGRIKPDEYPPDEWTFDAIITNRIKEAGNSKKPNASR
ncbi:MAG: hypothetical protein ACI8X5_002938 [Planctomycetota bacterium]|jgi:hypothetical protein